MEELIYKTLASKDPENTHLKRIINIKNVLPPRYISVIKHVNPSFFEEDEAKKIRKLHNLFKLGTGASEKLLQMLEKTFSIKVEKQETV